MNYQIPIKTEGPKRNHVVAFHIFSGLLFIAIGAVAFLSPVVLGVAQANHGSLKITYTVINWIGLAYVFLGFAIIIITIIRNRKLMRAKENMLLRIIEITGLAVIVLYSMLQEWWLPAAYSGAGLAGLILGLYFEYGSKAEKYIIIDDKGILIPKSGMSKKILWQDIKNIIYKNNVFTIDCRDDKLFQLDIPDSDYFKQHPVMEFGLNQIKEKEHLFQPDW